MRRFIIIGTLAALAAVSCSKQSEEPIYAEGEGGLHLSLSGPSATVLKSDESVFAELLPFECNIVDVQLLVFNADKMVQRYFFFDGDSECISANGTASARLDTTFTLTSGKKYVYAVVNGPDCSMVPSVDSLMRVKSALSEHNDGSRLAQIGMAECTVPDNGEASCQVEVQRLVGRVTLARVSNLLPPVYGDLSIKRVFLSNVATSTTLAGIDSEPTWANQYGRSDVSDAMSTISSDAPTSTTGYLFDRINTSITVHAGKSYEGNDLNLYAYANDCAAFTDHSGSTTWEEQATCLVLVCEVYGKDYYYPINLGAIEANKPLSVYLDIKSLGSKNPATPVMLGTLGAKVIIGGWGAGEVIYEII